VNNLYPNQFLFYRPDSRIQDQFGRILERVEVKKSEIDLKKAEIELVSKCFKINPYLYGGIHIAFGLAVAGKIAQLNLINYESIKCQQKGFIFILYKFLLNDSSIRSKILDCVKIACGHPNLTQLKTYNLTEVSDRIAMIVHVMVLAEMCQKLSIKFPPKDKFFKFLCSMEDNITRQRHGKNLNYIKINLKNVIYFLH